MQIKDTTKLISAALFGLMLSACGGGSSSPLDQYNSSAASNSSSSTNTSDGGSSSSASSVDTLTPAKLGYGSDSSFQNGVINVGIGNTALAAGGSTALTVNIVSSTNSLVTNTIAVTFNSKCIAAGQAKLTNGAGETVTSINSFGGEATLNYVALGCSGADEVLASATLESETVYARATISVEADTVGSVKFVDASPSQISIAGTGGAETSQVRFQVLGSTGAPIKNEEVSFKLDISTGGVTLTNPTPKSTTNTGYATTDINGYASITVKAGKVPQSVRVTATAASTNTATQSNKLLISTGLPDQDSMSLSASLLNPSGWDHDGETVDITIRMADAFNNPVPNGTAVTFTTEGGAIGDISTGEPVSGCFTTGGTCQVKWISQNPRPSDGRVTILATAVGNESFVDKGNYFYNDTEVDGSAADGFKTDGLCSRNAPLPSTTNPNNANACDDLGEAYMDSNENGMHDDGEFFVDLNNNNSYTTADGKYNGALCTSTDYNCSQTNITVRDQLILTMSSDAPDSLNGLLPGQPASLNVLAGASTSFTVTLRDIHGNSMPYGTKVAINSANSSDVTVTQNMPSTGVLSGTGPSSFTVNVKASDSKPASGSFDIQIIAPYATSTFTTVFN